MSIAATLQKHLPRRHIVYDVVSHSPTMASLSAEACCASRDRAAKGVVVRTGDSYVLAVLSASRQISRADLKMELGENFALASETEQLFDDCVPGAVRPVGEPYGLDGVVEPSICDQPNRPFRGRGPRDSNPVRQADRRRHARTLRRRRVNETGATRGGMQAAERRRAEMKV
jgi:Ala-tRNA(Pro) deacylase